MTAIRFIEAPSRRPGESGAAFIDRMLAELSSKKGSASALPVPPKIVIEPVAVVAPEVADAFGMRHLPNVRIEAKPNVRICRDKPTAVPSVPVPADPVPAADPVPETEVVDCVTGPFPAKEVRGYLAAQEAPLDWRGRPDRRPTTKSWPPGPMGPDGRSTHRYVGPWPPKWASKWTTGKYPK